MAKGKIMIVRHAEKPGAPPPPHGVDATGATDKESLIVRGWQRSGALACLFSAWGAAAHKGLAVPATIYATNPNGKSQRPEETVSAAAARLNLTVNLHFDEGQEVPLANAAMAAADHGPVLIGWHHESLPAIANRILGDAKSCPQHWPPSRFDVVWVLDHDGERWRFSQVPQMVLNGDQPTTIPMDQRAEADPAAATPTS
jgi:hypothetical protein